MWETRSLFVRLFELVVEDVLVYWLGAAFRNLSAFAYAAKRHKKGPSSHPAVFESTSPTKMQTPAILG